MHGPIPFSRYNGMGRGLMKKPKRKRNPKPKSAIKPARLAPDEANQPSFRAHALIWFGGATICLSVLGGLQTVVDFSPWATRLLDNWLDVTQRFWSALAGIAGFKLSPEASIPTTFVIGMLCLGFSAGSLERTAYEKRGEQHPLASPSLKQQLKSEEYHLRLGEGVTIALIIASALVLLGNKYLFDGKFTASDFVIPYAGPVLLVMTAACIISLAFMNPWRDFLHMLILAGSMTAFYILMLLPLALAARDRGGNELWSVAFMIINLSVFLLPSHIMHILTLARPKYWNYRFVLVWLTVGAVLALDQIAKLSASVSKT